MHSSFLVRAASHPVHKVIHVTDGVRQCSFELKCGALDLDPDGALAPYCGPINKELWLPGTSRSLSEPQSP